MEPNVERKEIELFQNATTRNPIAILIKSKRICGLNFTSGIFYLKFKKK